jgi:TAG lipase / steryl ester hydrolase / phospholipase A2 / LPA acyltransferase
VFEPRTLCVVIIKYRAASCSVPFIFSAASILAKDPKTGEAVPWNPSPQRWIDGSVDNDLPMTRLAELFNVNHFIVSQVNPHVVPFLAKEEDSITQEAQRSTATVASGPSWLHVISHLAKGEALHRMHTLVEMGIFPNTLTKAVSVLSQKYSGDINIFPEISYADFPRMLSNPTAEFMLQAQLSGERATWPKLSRIRNHCAIELALDDAVHKLRARVAFSPSQVDLRLTIHTRSNSDMRKGERGNHRYRHRPLSQKSTPDIKDTTLRLHTQADVEPEHFKHAPSMSTVTHDNFNPSTIQSSLEVPRALNELTSSGAETSNLTTSSSSSSLSSSPPTESSSPTFPVSSKPYRNFLFPSASQPATPSYLSTSFPPKTPPLTPHNALLTASNLLMTPKHPSAPPPGPSSAESRYKRLFHHRASSSAPTAPEPKGAGFENGENTVKRN